MPQLNDTVRLQAMFFNTNNAPFVPEETPVGILIAPDGSVVWDEEPLTQLGDNPVWYKNRTMNMVGDWVFYAYTADENAAGGGYTDATVVTVGSTVRLDTASLAALQATGVMLVSPYNATTGTITIYYGASYTAASPFGRIVISHAVSGLDLTAEGTITLGIKARGTAPQEPGLTLTGVALGANQAAFTMTSVQTKTFLPGKYVFDAVFTDASGNDTYFAAGHLIVLDTVTPTE